jgi:hypothetical protein
MVSTMSLSVTWLAFLAAAASLATFEGSQRPITPKIDCLLQILDLQGHAFNDAIVDDAEIMEATRLLAL